MKEMENKEKKYRPRRKRKVEETTNKINKNGVLERGWNKQQE